MFSRFSDPPGGALILKRTLIGAKWPLRINQGLRKKACLFLIELLLGTYSGE
jgi:hypothetical protein